MTKRLTTQEFIDRAKARHGNKYDYSLARYHTTDRKVTIVCPVHGKFYQRPGHHMKGQQCRKCQDKIRSERMKRR